MLYIILFLLEKLSVIKILRKQYFYIYDALNSYNYYITTSSIKFYLGKRTRESTKVIQSTIPFLKIYLTILLHQELSK